LPAWFRAGFSARNGQKGGGKVVYFIDTHLKYTRVGPIFQGQTPRFCKKSVIFTLFRRFVLPFFHKLCYNKVTTHPRIRLEDFDMNLLRTLAFYIYLFGYMLTHYGVLRRAERARAAGDDATADEIVRHFIPIW